MNDEIKPKVDGEFDENDYADIECEGCLAGFDCDGWTTETLKCPTRIPADRAFAEAEAYVASRYPVR